MKKTLFAFIFIPVLFFLLCCGKKGPIYPPLVNIPKPIKDFVAFQRGEQIILNWNNPGDYVDGSPIEEITKVEIWQLVEHDQADENADLRLKNVEEEGQMDVVTEKEEQEVEVHTTSTENFSENAKLLASIATKDFSEYQNKSQEQRLVGSFVYSHKLSSEDLKGRTNTFGLKAWTKKKESDFSALISIKPQALPCPPTGLKETVLEDTIQIEWTSPEKNIDDSTPADIKGYTVYRKAEGEGMHRVSTQLVTETKFSDMEFRFGETYTYYVRTSASESSPFLESGDSEPLKIVPKDTFPPKMPKGLVAIADDDFVSLSWDINREPDLAGYRIWRKGGDDKTYTALGELITENVYNDTAVKRNQKYDYAITAVDESGNESQKSKSISVIPGRE
jgi:hypothetical protein